MDLGDEYQQAKDFQRFYLNRLSELTEKEGK